MNHCHRGDRTPSCRENEVHRQRTEQSQEDVDVARRDPIVQDSQVQISSRWLQQFEVFLPKIGAHWSGRWTPRASPSRSYRLHP